MGRRGGDSYGAGLRTIDGWIKQLRSMPEMVKAAAPQVAALIQGELESAMSAGRSVDGTPWAPTKKGNAPLRGLPSALTMRISGTVITWSIVGYHVFHELGTGRTPRRNLLPKGGLPDKLGNAIRKGLVTMGAEWMTRAGSHKGSGGIKMQPSMGGG